MYCFADDCGGRTYIWKYGYFNETRVSYSLFFFFFIFIFRVDLFLLVLLQGLFAIWLITPRLF